MCLGHRGSVCLSSPGDSKMQQRLRTTDFGGVGKGGGGWCREVKGIRDFTDDRPC